MANEEINDQTAKTTAADTDEYLLQETGGGTNKKITRANLFGTIGLLNFSSLSATIASGAITATKTYIVLTGQGDAADDLDTINGLSNGDIVILRQASGVGGNVTVKDGTGNLYLAGSADFTFTNANSTMIFIARSSSFVLEISRSAN